MSLAYIEHVVEIPHIVDGSYVLVIGTGDYMLRKGIRLLQNSTLCKGCEAISNAFPLLDDCVKDLS